MDMARKRNRRRKAALGRVAAMLLAGVLLAAAVVLLMQKGETGAPSGLSGEGRTLVRVWLVDAPGGAARWLSGQVEAFEKQHSGTQVYLRQVTADELTRQEAILPDVALYMPGTLGMPGLPWAALEGDWPLETGLLAGGQLDGVQYALPLCWGGWVLAVNSAYDETVAATPAPTTLIGHAAQRSEAPTTPPPYPLSRVAESACPLLSPGGCALDALDDLLPELPMLTADFAQLSPQDVYRRFQAQQCASAMLTTGQVVAFSALVSGGKGFAFRVMTPATVSTDQVLLGSLNVSASAQAAELLSFLIGRSAQEALRSQGLFSVRRDLALYATGWAMEMEQAARRSLTMPNAFQPQEQAAQQAWQDFWKENSEGGSA